MRFPIRFDAPSRLLCRMTFLAPDDAHVDVGDDLVHVKFSWGFSATFARSSVAATRLYPQRPISRGVHGFAGRWLVNGAGDRILDITFEPTQRARVMGWPVKLRNLLVSVDDPQALAEAIRRREP
jgi:hypothetical protein